MVTEKAPLNTHCPFCGSKAAGVDPINYASGDTARLRIQCRDCGGATKWYDTAEEAWKAWSRRYVKICNELQVFIFNPDAFVYRGLLYIRNRPYIYCYAQKEFRGDLKRISKKDFLSAYQEAVNAQAERTNTEYEKTTGKVKG
jgi:hypothetical protein